MPKHTPEKRKQNRIAKKIKKLKEEGKSQKVAVAQAINTVNREGKKKRKGSTFV